MRKNVSTSFLEVIVNGDVLNALYLETYNAFRFLIQLLAILLKKSCLYVLP